MSFDPLAWGRAVRASNLALGPRCLAFAMGTRANKVGGLWGSAATFAADCGVSSRIVKQWLAILEEQGWIQIHRVTGGASSFTLIPPDASDVTATSEPRSRVEVNHVHPPREPRSPYLPQELPQELTPELRAGEPPAPPLSLSEEQQPPGTPQVSDLPRQADSGSAPRAVGKVKPPTFEDIFNGKLTSNPEPVRPAPGPQMRDITPQLAAAYLRGEAASPLASAAPPSTVPEVVPVPARRGSITESKL